MVQLDEGIEGIEGFELAVNLPVGRLPAVFVQVVIVLPQRVKLATDSGQPAVWAS